MHFSDEHVEGLKELTDYSLFSSRRIKQLTDCSIVKGFKIFINDHVDGLNNLLDCSCSFVPEIQNFINDYV